MAAGVAAQLEQLAVEDATTLETLPEELHPLILQFLDARSLVAAAGVCRAWQRHAETIVLQKLHDYTRLPKTLRFVGVAAPPVA